MILKMGKLGCPPNCLCKIFTNSLYPLTGVLIKESTTIYNPTFVYSFTYNDETALFNPIYFDYAILDEYHNDTPSAETSHFYFIDNIYIDAQGLLNVQCHLDVLTQNASTIITALKNGNMILSRCGTKKRSETEPIVDAQVQFAGRNYHNYTMTAFPNTPFTWTKPYFVLTVAGDGSVSSSTSSAKETTTTEEESDENSTSTS